jgi:hypothetical protein
MKGLAMKASMRLAVFAAATLTAFGAAYAVGAVSDPLSTAGSDGHDEAHAERGPAEPAAASTSPGLAVSDRGYTLRPGDVTLPAGGQVEFSFTIEGPDGQPVRDYRRTHEKEMHLIVVRRDLSLFQHVHPNRDEDGRWSVPVNLAAAGTYRMFADFAPAALGDQVLTLGTDTFVPGDFEPVDLPEPQAVSTLDGYEIKLEGAPGPGVASELGFTVTRAGTPVSDLEPYLGAFGHLVSLRAGDLAYLHTHPSTDALAGSHGGPGVRFATTFPTAGQYRLFLNFAHAGQVHTAAFTVDVPGPDSSPAAPTTTPTPSPSATASHDAGGHTGH